MKKSYLYVKFLFLFLFSVYVFSCSTPPPPNGQVNVPDDFLGIVHASRTLNPLEDKLLEEMGCKWILRTFYWHEIEPIKDVFSFYNFDIYAEHAHKQGIKIIGLLGYGNKYLYPKAKSIHYISKKNIPLFLRYVEETVSHFKGKVDVWCVWNEPDITSWKGTRSEFFNLSKLIVKKIREIDPDAYIIGGAFYRSPNGFIKSMNKAGGFKGLDGIAFHPYAFNPADCMNAYDKFTKILSEINYSGPVWMTEMGYPTGGWYPTKVSQKENPIFITKTITGAAARGVKALLWYEIFDRVDAGEIKFSSEYYFGLLYKDLSRKAGAWAYELCARYLPGSRYIPELPKRENIPSNIVSFCFLDGISGDNTLILWNDKNRVQNIELNLSSSALIHDISTGLNTPLPPASPLGVGNKPLFITWQGAAVPRLSIIR